MIPMGGGDLQPLPREEPQKGPTVVHCLGQILGGMWGARTPKRQQIPYPWITGRERVGDKI